jgi:hypothetical protein
MTGSIVVLGTVSSQAMGGKVIMYRLLQSSASWQFFISNVRISGSLHFQAEVLLPSFKSFSEPLLCFLANSLDILFKSDCVALCYENEQG